MVSLQSKRLLLVVFLLALFVAPSHSFKFPSLQQVEDALNKGKISVSSTVSSVVSETKDFFSNGKWDEYLNKAKGIEIFDEEKRTEFFSKLNKAKDSASSTVNSVVSETKDFFSNGKWDEYLNKVKEAEIFDEEKWAEFFSKVKDIRFSSSEEEKTNHELQRFQIHNENDPQFCSLNSSHQNSKECITELKQMVVRWIQENPGKVLIGVALTGGALTPILVPAGIASLGFTAFGVGPGSLAAYIMSFYGGAVPATSLFAVLQSVGAAGFSLGGNLALSFLGGMGGSGIGYIALEKMGADNLCGKESCE